MGKMDLLEPVFHPRQHDFVKGEAAWLFDRAGNRYLDLNEMCVFLGQGNRRFIDKVTEALNGVTNGRSSAVRYKEQLTDYLMESTNHIFKAVHYTASGSETGAAAMGAATDTGSVPETAAGAGAGLSAGAGATYSISQD